jgi:hypothetical protein
MASGVSRHNLGALIATSTLEVFKKPKTKNNVKNYIEISKVVYTLA